MRSDSPAGTGSLNSLYPFSLTDPESTLAEICVRYLLMDDFCGSEQFKLWRESGSKSRDRPEHPIPGVDTFLDYSAKHWAQHVRDMSDARYFPLEYLIRQLYDTSDRSFLVWFDSFWQGSDFQRFWSERAYDSHRIHPLRLASLNGHRHLLEQFLLESKGDFVPQTTVRLMREHIYENETGAFIWSSWAGHYDICCFLLKKGARLHPVALEAALLQGNAKIMQLLLERGGDSMRRSLEYGNALVTASENNNAGAIVFLLEAGFHVDGEEETKYVTPLVTACHLGYTDIVKLLLERGADVNARVCDQHGNHGALFSACAAGHFEIVETLLEKGAEANPTEYDHKNLLVAACDCGSVEIVKLLIEKGAHVDAREEALDDLRLSRSFPLEGACYSGSVEIVRILIENGVNVNATSRHGSCLALAIRDGHIGIALLLLEHGAQPNAPADKTETPDEVYKVTALTAACARGNIELVKLLLDRGADVNAKLGFEETALTAACSTHDNIEIIKLLLRRGAHADPDAFVAATARGDEVTMALLHEQRPDFNALSENRGGTTALETAFGADRFDSQVVDYLLKIGVNNQSPNFQKAFDRALIRACVHDNPRHLKMLLDAGASPHFKDKDSPFRECPTALHAAAGHGCIENLRLLLERGADINVVDSYLGSPLEHACRSGNNEALRVLLPEARNGMEISDQVYGQALLCACELKTTEAAEILLEAGVDIEYQDQEHGTALHVASESLNLDMVKLLLEYGASPNSQATEHEHGCPLLLLCADVHYGYSTAVRLEIVRMLVEYGADVNGHSGWNNSSALIEASRMGHLEIVKLLLQEGANIHAVDKHQRSTLMLSAAKGHVHIAPVLLSHGAHINYRREISKPVKDWQRHESWGEYFDCTETDETALQAAQACARDPDDDPMVQMLLENGATFTISSVLGKLHRMLTNK